MRLVLGITAMPIAQNHRPDKSQVQVNAQVSVKCRQRMPELLLRSPCKACMYL